MVRAFSAIDIEKEEVLNKLERAQRNLDLGFSAVSADKMHITLEFFQDIDQKQVSKIQQALENVEIKPFNIELKGVGAFPSEDHIRVIWADVRSEKIYKLHGQSKLHNVSSDNKHDFKPHVTLLRVDNISPKKKVKLRRTLNEHKQTTFGTVKVDKIKMFESSINQESSTYSEISTHHL
ncbi:RNA 2',3'-cyclic phosphodiesterase [Nanohaloarchaea archaeon]|nr:RNA 2',3'-cyclic phosphodiesterase [Candidatus Nanohaloarchaea archaeon]